MKYWIGIDGGGTKTALEALGEDGSVRYARTGAANYNFIGMDAALSNIQTGIAALEIKPEDIQAISFGDPSIDNEPENSSSLAFRDRLREIAPGRPVFIRSDAYMALWAITRGNAGVCVIAGTGAMGIAEDGNGTVRFSGGWGRLAGDEGSGYYIAEQAIRAALRSADGIEKPTLLLDALLRFCGCREPRELIRVFYGGETFEIAPFSRCVAECAAQGDETAGAVLRDAGQKLFGIADSLIRRCEIADWLFTVGISGSVIQKDAVVRSVFEKLLRDHYPLSKVREPEISPEHAAVLYAVDQMRIHPETERQRGCI